MRFFRSDSNVAFHQWLGILLLRDEWASIGKPADSIAGLRRGASARDGGQNPTGSMDVLRIPRIDQQGQSRRYPQSATDDTRQLAFYPETRSERASPSSFHAIRKSPNTGRSSNSPKLGSRYSVGNSISSFDHRLSIRETGTGESKNKRRGNQLLVIHG